MTPLTRHDDDDNDAPTPACAAHGATRPRLAQALSLLAALCLSLACAADARAQGAKKGARGVEGAAAAGEAEKEPPSNSTVRGRAVYEETGRPVRRGRVQLYPVGEGGAVNGGGGGASALTNAQGEFEFKSVPAGRYLVAAVVPGALVPASFPLYAEYGDGPVDYVKARQNFQEIVCDGVGEVEVNVRARRGGAITGRVAFENGDPAIGAAVTVALKDDGKQRSALGTGRGRRVMQTADDRGVYRVTGLTPGEYVVSVAEAVAHGPADNPRVGVGPFGKGALFETYYPAAASRREAAGVVVAAGEEKAGIDITVVERGLRKLSGTVVARKGGTPVADARVSIVPKDSPWASPPYTSYLEHQSDVTTDEQGRFSLREIPDGDYVIFVSPTPDVDAGEVFGPVPAKPKKKAAGAGGEEEEEEDEAGEDEYRQPLPRYAPKLQEVKVAGRDLEGVTVEMGGGGRIVGTITFEGGKGSTRYMPVYAVTLDESGAEARDFKGAVTWRDQFAIGGVMPGRAYVQAYVPDQSEGHYIKSITAGGKDLTREFLKIEEGTEVKGVRVVVAEGAGRLEGRVVSEGREKTPAAGADVLLVPADAAGWAHPGARFHTRTGWDGTFKATAPPGEYFVFLLAEKDANRIITEADVRAYTSGARRVTLRAKQSATVELTAAAAAAEDK